MKRKGNILTENLIFIILNLVFLAIMVVFIFMKMSSEAVEEEMRAKQIALFIDAAKPGMIFEINMEDEIKTAEKNGISPSEAVKIDGNIVTVRLKEDKGYSYSFFSDFETSVDIFPSDSNKPGIVRIFIE